jgi:hypothetical protein
VDAIEALIHQDVGRNAQPLFAAARGGLARAVAAIASGASPRIGIITGFFVPGGTPPAAETDGPAAAALLALGLTRAGLICRVLTDPPCRDACQAALTAAGLTDVPVDCLPPDQAIAVWRDAGINWALAIERCGRAPDGTLRNMRGQDIGAHASPLDDVFTAGPWGTIAIGDGGNEIGMGALPPGLIAATVAHGVAIACVTPADHLIVAGVSHWGAYALLGALAIARPDWRPALLSALDPAIDRAIVKGLVANGPAVDGVTLRRASTIDGLDMDAHSEKLAAVRDRVLVQPNT